MQIRGRMTAIARGALGETKRSIGSDEDEDCDGQRTKRRFRREKGGRICLITGRLVVCGTRGSMKPRLCMVEDTNVVHTHVRRE